VREKERYEAREREKRWLGSRGRRRGMKQERERRGG
jgi:hypothetical protein